MLAYYTLSTCPSAWTLISKAFSKISIKVTYQSIHNIFYIYKFPLFFYKNIKPITLVVFHSIAYTLCRSNDVSVFIAFLKVMLLPYLKEGWYDNVL